MEERQVLAVPWVIPITSATTALDATWTLQPSQSVGPFNFVWTRLSIQTSVAAAIWSILIKDEAASENFMYTTTRTNLLVPDDSHMVDIVRPWVFKAFSTIYVEGTNRSAEGILYIAFHGYLEK